MNLIKSTTLALVAAFFPLSALAEDKPDWIVTAVSTDEESWEVKRYSLILRETKAGVPMSLVIGRVVLPDNTVKLYRWYVTDADCSAEYGKLAILDIEGAYLGETDYLKGAGTLASATAEAICEGAKYMRTQKGI